MLGWTTVFFLLTLISAVFGFGGVAADGAGAAKFSFFVFLALFAATLFYAAWRSGIRS